MGAAIQTGIIQGEVKDLVLLDVTPHTLGHRDQGRHLHAAHRAQQHHPHPEEPGLHHRRRQPDPGRGPRPAGRERHVGLQQEPGQVRAHQHPAGAQGRAPDRGLLRDRRQRHRVGLGAGPGDRAAPVHDHPPLRRPQPVRGLPPGGGDADPGARGAGEQGPRGRRPPARRPGGQHHALGPGPRGQAQPRGAGGDPRRHREGQEGPRPAKKGGANGDELKQRLADMEKAATVIGKAMLRS